MADLILNVTNQAMPQTRMQDGDVIAAINDEHIQHTHIQHIVKANPSMLDTYRQILNYNPVATMSAVNAMWDYIEANSSHVRGDYQLWPLGNVEKYQLLPVRVTNFTYEEEARMMRPEMKYADTDITQRNELTMKRRANVNWRGLGLDETAVLDPQIAYDDRSTQRNFSDILSYKPRRELWLAAYRILHGER